MTTVRKLLALIEDLAPARLAEEWDNCGLMVGAASWPAHRVSLALDPTPDTVRAAIESGADILLTHHPLIFRPLKKIDLDQPGAQSVALALTNHLAIIAAHTNLDAAREGVGRTLAQVLGLRDTRILSPFAPDRTDKLVVFMPLGYEGEISGAAFEAGAGLIGTYTGCSFFSRGEGTFTPAPESEPFLGEKGSPNRVSETRMELTVRRDLLPRVIKAVRAVHPYDEPVMDVYPMHTQASSTGLGCLGRLPAPMDLDDLIEHIRTCLGIGWMRVAAPFSGKVEEVAVMPGSGGGYLGQARAAGAKVLISGDLGYHQARDAEHLGICLIDAGHWATERPVLDTLAENLKTRTRKMEWDLSIEVLTHERDPWNIRPLSKA